MLWIKVERVAGAERLVLWQGSGGTLKKDKLKKDKLKNTGSPIYRWLRTISADGELVL